MFEGTLPLLVLWLRSFLKCFLHTFTRLCELQRLCYGAQAGLSRAKKVERSLQLSKHKDLQAMVRQLDEFVEHCSDDEFKQQQPAGAINIVCRAKRIKPAYHPDFPALFGQCVMQIWSYRRLMHIVERLRAQQYDVENLEHERRLLNLWTYLVPEQRLEGRVSKQWQEIGFQGDDPKTDFRGMGMLGLENLVYFATEYNDAAQHVLLHSMHPRYGYTFAIVGINLTSMAFRLLQSGSARTHFYNLSAASKQPSTLRDFHNFYCYLLLEFDRFWVESEPLSIMDFSEIYQRFEANILAALENDSTLFRVNLVVQNV